MYYLLDNYYFADTSNDDLAVVLGSMNPNLFGDSYSADSAYWEDWCIISKASSIKEPLSIDELMSIICLFLETYQKEYGFDLNEVIKKVKSLSERDKLFVKSILKKLDFQTNDLTNEGETEITMTNSDRQKLIEVLTLAAADADTQISVFPDFVHIPDEIALVISNAAKYVPITQEDKDILEVFKEIDETLLEYAGQENFWTIENLQNGYVWQKIRLIARSKLKELNIPESIPNLFWLQYMQ